MIQVLVVMCVAGTAVMVDPHELYKEPTCEVVKEVLPVDPAFITPHACMMNAAKVSREWLDKHPKYTARYLRCGKYRPEAEA